MRYLKLKRIWALILLAIVFATFSSCGTTSSVILKTAPNKPSKRLAEPPINAQSLEEWEQQKPLVNVALQRDVYGSLPSPANVSLVEKTPLLPNIYPNQGRAEAWDITIDIAREDGTVAQGKFGMALILPKSNKPVPIISMQTFCPTNTTLPNLGIDTKGNTMCEGEGFGAGLMFFVFGRHIATPPIEDILAKGYGIAAMYPSDLLPDNRLAGRHAVTNLFGASAQGADHNASIIGGWAYMWAAAAKALASDPDIDGKKIASFGHSRYGKSALLVGAWSDDIQAVISHQSGTGGASISRNKPGETVTQIMDAYPHWFASAYAQYDTNAPIVVDQHHLLALIAPKPILLGNARRDVWSDPVGAFHAAQGADSVYELYGVQGLTAEKLSHFDPKSDLSFWIRGGTHGIVKEDWPAFLEFLDSHFK
ncbi:MAG: hypothetical protein ABJ275_01345 [Maricaulaceae bacterium]